MTITVTDQEFAHILAGLRLLQRDPGELTAQDEIITELVENEGHGLLSNEELDALCEKINVTLAPAVIRRGKLICPHCRAVDSFRYVEDISSGRDVEGIIDGALAIQGYYETEGFDEEGENQRLLCCKCGKDSALPEKLEVTFE